ncbi:MAG: glycosyltransferase, partial [Sandaracinaceae bacterium]|nr:glycosyltransferase [Sandaracinaceae bacterium]
PSGAGARARFVGLADEPDRRAAHAAADLAWVPRGAPGGLPMKLLDALSRGVPTVAVRRATAGIELGDAATVVRDDDPEALAAAALITLEARDAARALGLRGRAHVAREHDDASYLAAIDALETAASTTI